MTESCVVNVSLTLQHFNQRLRYDVGFMVFVGNLIQTIPKVQKNQPVNVNCTDQFRVFLGEVGKVFFCFITVVNYKYHASGWSLAALFCEAILYGAYTMTKVAHL